MPVSSSSVVHITRKKSALKGILNNGFRISYCVEALRAEDSDKVWAVPMVSFCDIPLSQVKEHIGKYGSYGIGLTKTWAMQKALSPVQYIATGSLYAKSIKLALNAVAPKARKMDPATLTQEQRAALDIIRYSKNYEGVLRRSGKKPVHNYRYYDEREWRFVPIFEKNYPMMVPVESDFTSRKKVALNKAVSELCLSFTPSDIKYIIVKDDLDIPEFIDVIRSAKSNHYTQRETELLTTRIITTEQIKTDF